MHEMSLAEHVREIIEDAAGAHWVDDADFQLERHVVTHKLARHRGQSEQAALQARVADHDTLLAWRAAEAGFDHVLAKPLIGRALLDALDRHRAEVLRKH